MLEDQSLPSFGYCKVSVFECARDSYIFTKNTLDKDPVVIVPSASCVAFFRHFFGVYENLFTPKKILEILCNKLGKQNKLIPPILIKILFKNYLFNSREEVGIELFEFKKLCENLSKYDAENLTKWIEENNFFCAEKIFNFYENINKNLFEKVILYGNFDYGIFCNFCNFLKKISNFVHIITHTPTDLEFLKSFSNEFKFFDKQKNKTTISVQSFDYFAEEIIEIKTKINTSEKQSIAIIEPIFNNALTNSLNSIMPLNTGKRSKPLCEIFNAFFNWMLTRDCTFFISFLMKLDEHGLRKFNVIIEEEFIQASNRCLTNDYNVLWHYLISEKNLIELENYSPVFFNKNACFSEFFSITKNCLSQFFKEFFEQNCYLETLKIDITAENFIAAMQDIIFAEAEPKDGINCLYPATCDIKTAISFPFTEVILPFFNNNIWPIKNKNYWNFSSENEQKKFLEKVFTLNAKVFVSFSKKSENGDKIALSDTFYEIFGKAPKINHKTVDGNFNEHELVKIPKTTSNNYNSLHLPTECLDFSCKTWERFKLAPLQTFFEKILKLNSPNMFIINTIKNKRIGELSHNWVSFEKSKNPKFIETWLNAIFANYEKEKTFLKKIYTASNKQLYSLITQTLNKALTAAITFANACKIFLQENLYSEYTLQKSTKVKYAGRIDMLVKHSISNLTVIDFKNSKNLLLTPSQLLNGYGLQLLLYGAQLKSIGAEDVTLMVLSSNGSSHSCSLNQIYDKVSTVINWVNEMYTSGIYENLPPENDNSLPIILSKPFFEKTVYSNSFRKTFI